MAAFYHLTANIYHLVYQKAVENAPVMSAKSKVIIAGGVVLVASAAVTSNAASIVNFVTLQTAAPGFVEAGHINISGTSAASTFRVDTTNANAGTFLPGIQFGSTSSAEGISSDRSGTGTNHHGLDIYTNGAKRVSITNGGKVGIGTNAPTAKLQVVGDGSFSGNLSAPNLPAIKSNRDVASRNLTANLNNLLQSLTVNVPADGQLKISSAFHGTRHADSYFQLGLREGNNSLLYTYSVMESDVPVAMETVIPVTAGTHTYTLEALVAPWISGAYMPWYEYSTLTCEYYGRSL